MIPLKTNCMFEKNMSVISFCKMIKSNSIRLYIYSFPTKPCGKKKSKNEMRKSFIFLKIVINLKDKSLHKRNIL